MARKTKEEAEKTYLALLEAAAKLFSSQGVATTTLNEIAKSAGVTRGAFYWHFKDKDEVIRALWETYALPRFDPIKTEIEEMPVEDSADRFRQIMQEMVMVFVTDENVRRAVFIVMHNMEYSEKQHSLQDYLRAEHVNFQSALTSAFDKIAHSGRLKCGVESRQAALGFQCLFMGIINKHLLPFTSIDLERDGMVILQSYFDGLLIGDPN